MRTHLPRITRGALTGLLGGGDPGAPIEAWRGLADAAAAAVGLPTLEGSSAAATAARRAATRVAGRRLRTVELAGRLGVSARTVKRLRAQAVDPRLVSAVAGQLGLRQGPLSGGDGLSQADSGPFSAPKGRSQADRGPNPRNPTRNGATFRG